MTSRQLPLEPQRPRRILVLGGTGWLGAEIVRAALHRGHHVVALARGTTGPPPVGAHFIPADRCEPNAYDDVAGERWDDVIEVSWQPRFVREALTAVGLNARHWTYVSSCSVYACQDDLGADESAQRHSPAAESTGTDAPSYGPAKAACEALSEIAMTDRLLCVRPGLIGGPGDPTDRSGYWVARCLAAQESPLVAPLPADAPTQVIDVRDLASWVLSAGERHLTGTFNAVGPKVALADWVAICRLVGGHRGPTVWADPGLLLERGVAEFAGESSLPLWIADPDFRGFFDRDGSAAERLGLHHRPRVATLADILSDERARGLHRPRKAGLTLERERELIADLAVHQR